MASLSRCSWFTLVIRPPSSFLSSPSPKVLPLPCLHCHRRSICCAASKSATTTEKKELRGIMRPRPISPALQSLVGVPEISRTEALKKIWAYIKENNLQDPDNKKIIVCDEMLRNVFGGKEKVGFLEISGLINPHFVK